MDDVAELWGLHGRCVTPDLVAATELLMKHVKPDRLSVVLNRRAPGLGDVSLIDLAATGDTAGVLAAVVAMFDVDHVIR